MNPSQINTRTIASTLDCAPSYAQRVLDELEAREIIDRNRPARGAVQARYRVVV
jgi:DNA-binding MarR family transcriptional regulator